MITALLLLLALPAHAAPALEFSGYLKELWQYSHSGINDRPYFLNLDRARLTMDGHAGMFKAHVDYDQEVLAGSFFRTPEYKLYGIPEPNTWLHPDKDIASSGTSLWRQHLYRGWAGLETEGQVLRFGRQRIAWGTGKLWNPTDVLNPYQPLAVERDERLGVDSAYLRQSAGVMSQGELAYAPQDHWPQSSILGRAKSVWKNYDVSLMGGKVAGSTTSWIVGGDFAGNLWDGSLHGEWSYTDPITQRPYWRATVGYEYTFGSEAKPWLLKDASTLIEYYHNGHGAAHTDHYDRAQLITGQEISLARDYIGVTFSKDIHPLVKFEAVFIDNLDDASQFFSPSLQYNVLSNLYLTAGWQYFGGGRGTEFGWQPNRSYLQAQYFF